jgi:murein DD-endopeptidase MepM/ murein hydrolase activator NlpD
MILALSLPLEPAKLLAQITLVPAVNVEVTIPMTATPVRSGDKNLLVYELHITNFDRRELILSRLEVRNYESAGAPLAVYEEAALADMIQPLAIYGPPADNRRIAPGVRAIVFMWLALDASKPPPSNLKHRLTFTSSRQGGGGGGAAEIVLEATFSVSQSPSIRIGPPLRGDIWLAGNGPGNAYHHRRAYFTIDGKARIGQRFATDWVQYGKNDDQFNGDKYRNADYYAYGAEALAVADGVVSSTKDGIPENVPGPNSRAVPITMETVTGNHVILDLGGGTYAAYAHLQPGSIRVKLGQRVRKGQVLGLVGNSGNSDCPHLHFQLCNANSFLGSEGLPFVFESFKLIGRDGRALPNGKTEDRQNEMPLLDDVINFGPAKR